MHGERADNAPAIMRQSLIIEITSSDSDASGGMVEVTAVDEYDCLFPDRKRCATSIETLY